MASTLGCSSVAGFQSFPGRPQPDDVDGGGAIDAAPPPATCPNVCAPNDPGPCPIACGEDLPGKIAAAGGSVVWSTRGQIRSVDRESGAAPKTLATATPASALVLASGTPVWTDGASIFAARQGAAVTIAQQPAAGLASAGDAIYWTNAAAGAVFGCSVAACTPQAIHSNQLGAGAIAAGLDPSAHARAVWVVKGAAGRELHGAGLSPPSAPATLLQNDALDLVAMDPADATIAYAVGTGASGVEVLGATGDVVGKMSGALLGLSIAKGELFMLLQENGKGRVVRIRSAGARDVVVGDLADPAGVSADEKYVYVTSGDRVLRVAR